MATCVGVFFGGLAVVAFLWRCLLAPPKHKKAGELDWLKHD